MRLFAGPAPAVGACSAPAGGVVRSFMYRVKLGPNDTPFLVQSAVNCSHGAFRWNADGSLLIFCSKRNNAYVMVIVSTPWTKVPFTLSKPMATMGSKNDHDEDDGDDNYDNDDAGD